jgi:hypothetical protein
MPSPGSGYKKRAAPILWEVLRRPSRVIYQKHAYVKPSSILNIINTSTYELLVLLFKKTLINDIIENIVLYYRLQKEYLQPKLRDTHNHNLGHM